jgi:hypothetical protein
MQNKINSSSHFFVAIAIMCTIILFITQPAEASISGDLENGSFYSANGALTGLVTTDLVHSLF